jgi:hypothetical protein
VRLQAELTRLDADGQIVRLPGQKDDEEPVFSEPFRVRSTASAVMNRAYYKAKHAPTFPSIEVQPFQNTPEQLLIVFVLVLHE